MVSIAEIESGSIEDLWALGPSILSLSVVPVGLTRYNAMVAS